MKTITYDDTKYKLVPLEATEEMEYAAERAQMRHLLEDKKRGGKDPELSIRALYRYILAAAPTVPDMAAVERIVVLEDALRNIRDYRTDVTAEAAAPSMRFYAQMALDSALLQQSIPMAVKNQSMDVNKLHADIMNIQCEPAQREVMNDRELMAYKIGHRDARHAAAELVISTHSTKEP